jgi:hypothetical protein
LFSAAFSTCFPRGFLAGQKLAAHLHKPAQPALPFHCAARRTIMPRYRLATAALLFATAATALTAQAQTARPDNGASMVKPPAAPGAPSENATRPNNPDNMPVKRPDAPQNSDRMLHHSPASDAIAK